MLAKDKKVDEDNEFYVKKIKEDKITVAEEDGCKLPWILFFRRNGRLIYGITMFLSLIALITGAYFTISNMGESSIVMYETNGVVVEFDKTDQSIINGTPITSEYASKVFESNIQNVSSSGVVIEVNEVSKSDSRIIFYSDKTALVKYKDGSYLRVFPVNNNYGILENGIIDIKAVTKKVSGEFRNNKDLGINLLFLSDGSIEVSNKKTTFFVRNSDVTNTKDIFYTNLSNVAIPVNKHGNTIYYSNGVIKENKDIVVDGKKYNIVKQEKIHDNINIIYYDNGYAEVVKSDLSIMVGKKEHIVYDNNIFEIVYSNNSEVIDIKDIMDIKSIKLENTNTNSSNYMIVLEETDDYNKHNITRRLANEYIRYNVYINGQIQKDNILNNNIFGKGIISTLKNNTYLLSEGVLEGSSELSVKIGMWVSYEDITNEYMNSAFIGTVKVYVESHG